MGGVSVASVVVGGGLDRPFRLCSSTVPTEPTQRDRRDEQAAEDWSRSDQQGAEDEPRRWQETSD